MRLATIALAVLVVATAGPARAGETGWQEFAPDTRVRIISSDVRAADGTVMAAVELEMPAGTKTYWRVPGETGIPTRLDLAGSVGIAGHRFIWPYPRVEVKEGYTDFVYYGSMVIPLVLTVEGDAPVLQAALLMGICSDICVPAMADFTLPIDLANPDPGNDLRIAQAFADVPIAWDGSGDPLPRVALDPAERQLLVSIDVAALDPTSLIADATAGGYLVGAPQKSREAGVVALPLIGDGDGSELLDTSIELLFMTPNGPYVVSRRVERSTQP